MGTLAMADVWVSHPVCWLIAKNGRGDVMRTCMPDTRTSGVPE